MESPQHKKLYRSRTDRIIGGVCGGLGKYFDIDPIIFRIVFFLLTIAHGSGIFIYIIMMIIVPNETTGGPEPLAGSSGKDVINNFAQEVRQSLHSFANEVKGQHWANQRRNSIGMIVVLIGALLLLQQLFPITFFNGNFLWPLVLIIVGIFIISKRT